MKMNKNKRPLKLIICLMMVISAFITFVVMPTEVLATGTAATEIWINDGTTSIEVIGATVDEKNTLSTLGVTYTDGVSDQPGKLTLNDAILSAAYSSGDRFGTIAGIHANGDLIIEVVSTNIINYGIFVDGNLTIEGSGNLTAGANEQSGKYSSSIFGVYVLGDCTINSATVTANGGVSEGSSYGIRGDKINISEATVTANGDFSKSSSYGIKSSTINITKSTVTVTGGDTGRESFGINCETAINISDAKVTASGVSESGNSYGIYSTYGAITIQDFSDVTAIAETGINSFGIFAGHGGDIIITDATVTVKTTSTNGKLFSKVPTFTDNGTNGADVTYNSGAGDVVLYSQTNSEVTDMFASGGILSLDTLKSYKIVMPAPVIITLSTEFYDMGVRLSTQVTGQPLVELQRGEFILADNITADTTVKVYFDSESVALVNAAGSLFCKFIAENKIAGIDEYLIKPYDGSAQNYEQVFDSTLIANLTRSFSISPSYIAVSGMQELNGVATTDQTLPEGSEFLLLRTTGWDLSDSFEIWRDYSIDTSLSANEAIKALGNVTQESFLNWARQIPEMSSRNLLFNGFLGYNMPGEPAFAADGYRFESDPLAAVGELSYLRMKIPNTEPGDSVIAIRMTGAPIDNDAGGIINPANPTWYKIYYCTVGDDGYTNIQSNGLSPWIVFSADAPVVHVPVISPDTGVY